MKHFTPISRVKSYWWRQ